MNHNTQMLIDFIETLDRFKIVETIDGNYDHIGATLVDGILQSGVRYETVVKPRVVSILTHYPDHTSTSSFQALCEEKGIKNIISWNDDRKPNLIIVLLSILRTEKIETCQQFSVWLDQEQNIHKLRSINGIGPKTIDYFKILLGKETVAVDVHLKRFFHMAGIEITKYDEIKSVITEAANYLKIRPSVLDHSIWEFMTERK